MAKFRLHKGLLQGKLKSIKYGWIQTPPGLSSGKAKKHQVWLESVYTRAFLRAS
jgi:hypothetical protein